MQPNFRAAVSNRLRLSEIETLSRPRRSSAAGGPTACPAYFLTVVPFVDGAAAIVFGTSFLGFFASRPDFC